MSREILYSRRINDKLIPWTLTLDDEGVMISDGPSTPLEQPKQVHRPITVSHEERSFRGRFLDLETPCFFQGCEDLRQQMSAELSTLAEDCSPCSRTPIQHKFATIAWDVYQRMP